MSYLPAGSGEAPAVLDVSVENVISSARTVKVVGGRRWVDLVRRKLDVSSPRS